MAAPLNRGLGPFTSDLQNPGLNNPRVGANILSLLVSRPPAYSLTIGEKLHPLRRFAVRSRSPQQFVCLVFTRIKSRFETPEQTT
jgi:hypothetical protein